MAGNNTKTLNNTETQGCWRELAADGGTEITACRSHTRLGLTPRCLGSEGAKPEGARSKKAKPKDAKPKYAKPEGAVREPQEPGRNNGSNPGWRCQPHACRSQAGGWREPLLLSVHTRRYQSPFALRVKENARLSPTPREALPL